MQYQCDSLVRVFPRGTALSENCRVSEPVLLMHGYDSKPSALGDLADRLGDRAELVAGFEDLPEETFAWWLGDLSVEARQDLTEYLDEISLEAGRAFVATKAEDGATGLVGLLTAKGSSDTSRSSSSVDSRTSVSVAGFSQGAAAALSWLIDARRQTMVSTVVAVAGFLDDLTEAQLRERPAEDGASERTSHIHMVHLSDDEVVDAMVSERASRLLAKAGFTVTDHHVDGSHTWSAAVTDLTARLLS
jgi:Phospholipase/Carboxylesterase